MKTPAPFTVKEAAARMGITEREVQIRCTEGRLLGAHKVGGQWLIPVTANEELRQPAPVPGVEALAELGPEKRDQALERLGHIKAAEAFVGASVREGGLRGPAEVAYCAQHGLAVDTLRRWARVFRSEGLAGLVDGRGRGVAVKKTEATMSSEAWEMFKALFLDQRRMSAKQCLEVVKYINAKDGKAWNIPSLRTVQRMVIEQIPLAVRVLHREGEAAYDAQCAPYLQVDLEAIEPGSVWVGDHHQCNCFVWYKGKLIRPWLTAWEDMRSRLLLGFHVSDTPNSTTILRAYKMGVETYGPPDSVKIDNGRDYDSETFTGTTKQRRRAETKGWLTPTIGRGVYALTATSVSFSIPYHPQSKCIERYFDTLDTQYVKTMTSYCGKTTEQKPEKLQEYLRSERAQTEIPTLEAFAKQVGQWIDLYNRTPHSGRGMNGKAPAEVMATRTTRRVVRDDVLRLLLRMWSPELKVGKNGVRWRGIWFGQFEEQLYAYQGKKVVAAADPDDFSRVAVFEAESYRFICEASAASLVRYGPTNDAAIREAHAAKARAKKIAKKSVDKRRIAHTDIAALALEAREAAARPVPESETAVVKPVATILDGAPEVLEKMRAEKARRQAAQSKNILTNNPAAAGRYGRFLEQPKAAVGCDDVSLGLAEALQKMAAQRNAPRPKLGIAPDE